ncbi:hypothetical protein GCM10009727_54510 [Actinomadura napierensis]|uniref:Uncharacterized protein n=1 Tax=Actinomadura napierensis TaxID=267854 RepID=A0ABN2ZYT1_9ACTN
MKGLQRFEGRVVGLDRDAGEAAPARSSGRGGGALTLHGGVEEAARPQYAQRPRAEPAAREGTRPPSRGVHEDAR